MGPSGASRWHKSVIAGTRKRGRYWPRRRRIATFVQKYTRERATLKVSLLFDPGLIGQVLQSEVSAQDDIGRQDPFTVVGVPPVVEGGGRAVKEDTLRSLTREQRRLINTSDEHVRPDSLTES
jgi:hypothetical protein